MKRPKHPDPLKQLADAKRVSQKEKLEGAFLAAWCRLPQALPMPEREHRFCVRRWRFDFAWPAIKLAVELDGGAFTGGGHGRGLQQAKDYEKQNAAVSLGWRVLRFNTASKDMDAVAEQVAHVMCGLPIPHE
jgi:very-short-patch-repair endonuclease